MVPPFDGVGCSLGEDGDLHFPFSFEPGGRIDDPTL